MLEGMTEQTGSVGIYSKNRGMGEHFTHSNLDKTNQFGLLV